MPFLTPCLGEGSPTKIDCKIKIGTLVLPSLLDLLEVDSQVGPTALACKEVGVELCQVRVTRDDATLERSRLASQMLRWLWLKKPVP